MPLVTTISRSIDPHGVKMRDRVMNMRQRIKAARDVRPPGLVFSVGARNPHRRG